MRAEILCVGTELLLGDIVNTNAAYIAKELAAIGVNVYHQAVAVSYTHLAQKSKIEKPAARELLTAGLGSIDKKIPA